MIINMVFLDYNLLSNDEFDKIGTNNKDWEDFFSNNAPLLDNSKTYHSIQH